MHAWVLDLLICLAFVCLKFIYLYFYALFVFLILLTFRVFFSPVITLGFFP